MPRKLTTEEFIKRAKAVHGEKYAYDQVEYVDSKIKVVITCPEHGSFRQAPVKYVSGQGCRDCGNKRIAKASSSSRNTFIEKAQEIHRERYDYDKVEYFDAKTKVILLCPGHGYLKQTPVGPIRSRKLRTRSKDSK